MRDAVVAAHRSLDDLFEHTRAALEEGLVPASEAFARLHEALEAHFEREDSLYYPSIAALRVHTRDAVAHFAEAHDEFREELQEIDTFLQKDDLERAGRAFEAFSERFVRHEATEEALLRELDRGVGAAS